MGLGMSRLFVGREAQLLRMREAVSRATHGTPQIVVVEGEAGIGKTRLVREIALEIADADADALIATGHGIDLAGGSIPYGVMGGLLQDLVWEVGAEAVEGLLGVQAQSLHPLVPSLPAAPAHDAALDRLALFVVTQHLLATLSRERFVVLFLEDLHWADAASLDLLTFVARSATRGRLLIVLTTRTSANRGALLDLARLEHGELVHLGPLDTAAIHRQVDGSLGADRVDRDLVRRLVELSDGIPLYVEELLAGADAGAPGTAIVPVTLALTLTARLEGISPGSRWVLEVAALEERPFEVSDLAQVTDLPDDDVRGAVAEGIEHGVLDELGRDRFRFHHALVRHAVRETLASPRRREWHRRWADHIERDAPGSVDDDQDTLTRTSAIAHHRYNADDPDRALVAAVRAAEAALRLDAPREAALQWQRALQLWSTAERPDAHGLDRPTLVVRLSDALELSAMETEALAFVEAETRRDPNPPRVESLWRAARAASARFELGQPFEPVIARVGDLADLVAELADELPSRMLFDLCRLLEDSLPLNASPSPRDLASLNHLRESVAEAIDHESGLAGSLARRAEDASWNGDVQLAFDLSREAVRVAAGSSPAVHFAAVQTLLRACRSLGRLNEVVELGERTLGQIGSPLAEPTMWQWTASVLAQTHLDMGHVDRARQLLLGQVEFPVSVRTGASHAALALLEARYGTEERAREHLARAYAQLHPVGTEGSNVNWSGLPVLAEVELLCNGDRPAAAVAALVPVLADGEILATSTWNWTYLLAAARAWAAAGSGDDPVRDLVTQLSAAMTPHGLVGEAWTTEIAAHLAGAAPSSAWRAAVDAWAAVGAVHDETMARLRLAEALAREGDRPVAEAELITALETARQMSAGPLEREVLALGTRARIPLPGQRARSPAAGLTAREREVLQLLAAGHSNGDIATALFMSPKTASVHVSRIIAKLGVTNRTQAAAVAHREGLLA